MSEPLKDAKSEIKKLITLNDDLENYFRNTIIPQLFVDADLVLRKFTPPAMKHFALAPDDIGKHINEISHRIRFPTFLEDINEVISSSKDFEKEIQTSDLRWFQMNILPYKVFNENRTNGVIITFVNITDRINYLKEIEKLNADHETFIYSVSHDVRGPIGNLQSLIEILKETTSTENEECKRVVHMINSSVADLKGIVDELTDVTRTKIALVGGSHSVNLANILEEVKLTLNDKISASGAKIVLHLNVLYISFLRKNIRSILYNLLSNAIKYKFEGRNPEILVKTEEVDSYTLLSIQDNGMGIEENKMGMLFMEFSRINQNLEGSGIGLYIVNKLVENSGGKIEVESVFGVGTTFKIYFKK